MTLAQNWPQTAISSRHSLFDRTGKFRCLAVPKIFNYKIEVKFFVGTVENLTGAVPKSAVAWISGNWAGRQHSGFSNTLQRMADGKSTKKTEYSTDLVVSSVRTERNCWTVPCKRTVRSNFTAGRTFVQEPCDVSLSEGRLHRTTCGQRNGSRWKQPPLFARLASSGKW